MARAARSLDALLRQINELAPRRSRISDGGIADSRHLKAGTSDHIADDDGVFHARDFTHDPAGGFDAYAFADRILTAQDPRLAYVISHGRIGAGPAGVLPGRWRRYTGANQHDHHTHVSVVSGARGDQDHQWARVRPVTHEEDDDMPTADQIAEAVWAKKLTNKGGDEYPARDIFAAVDEHVGITRRAVGRLEEGQASLSDLVRAIPRALLTTVIASVRTRRKGAEAYEDIPLERALARAAEAPITYQRQDDASKGTP